MIPAQIYRELTDPIYAENLTVEVQLDIAWIFLRKTGFNLIDFGDVTTRSQHLGKWIAIFPRNKIVQEVKRLLPLIHSGKIKIAKFTNIANFPNEEAIIAVYCLSQDLDVMTALKHLGWSLRWKYNYQTFDEHK